MGVPTRMRAEFASETYQTRKVWPEIFHGSEEKHPPTNNLAFRKAALSKWRDKDIPRQAKTEMMYLHQTCPTRNAKGSSSN